MFTKIASIMLIAACAIAAPTPRDTSVSHSRHHGLTLFLIIIAQGFVRHQNCVYELRRPAMGSIGESTSMV